MLKNQSYWHLKDVETDSLQIAETAVTFSSSSSMLIIPGAASVLFYHRDQVATQTSPTIMVLSLFISFSNYSQHGL